jgi:hypothetical protein
MADNSSKEKHDKIDVRDLFLQAARKLKADFDAASVILHRGVKGSNREATLRAFLDNHLPNRFRTATGFLVDSLGRTGRQTDIMIYDALHAPRYSCGGESLILHRDAVPVVIEVKSNLRKEHLDKCIKDASLVKDLYKTTLEYDRLNLRTKEKQTVRDAPRMETMCVLFAYSSTMSLSSIAKYWYEKYLDVPFGNQLDWIIVLDRGIVCVGGVYPELDMRKGGMTPISCLTPYLAVQEPKSLLLFGNSHKLDNDFSFRVGARVPWPPGHRLYITYGELGDFTLDFWYHRLTHYLKFFCAPAVVPDFFHVGKEYESIPIEVLPLAISVNEADLQEDKQATIGKAFRELWLGHGSQDEQKTTDKQEPGEQTDAPDEK